MLDDEHESVARWAAIISIASKIGCTGKTLNEWVKKDEFATLTWVDWFKSARSWS